MGWQPMEPDYATCGMNNWVGSFDPVRFIYFMLATVLIPYPVYIFVATVFNWEHNAKRPARHYQDLLKATSYGLIVFIFGNYAQTLNWITILAFWITWPSYSMIAELDFAKTSLPSWKTWPFGMYALFAGATAVVLVFAGYHVYLAIQLTKIIPGFVGYYLLGLLIPVILTLIGYACLKQQNTDVFHLSKLYNWMLQLQWRQKAAVEARKLRKQQKIDAAAKKQQPQQTIDPPSDAENGNAGTSSTEAESAPSTRNGSRLVSRNGSRDFLVESNGNNNDHNNNLSPSTFSTTAPAAVAVATTTVTAPSALIPVELEVTIQPYQPYVWSAFDHWVSRVGGGIVLGCYMQGIMAYGFDYLIEE
ncbi:hypothetical protein BGZ83_003595 [Gryganskiella cystojenkinii]|nr:hypothetical protein BGZ83_003595 [Gryganskiella cystojenkinii]